MKNIKSYYRFFDLPYDASEDDVILRQRALIRLSRTNAININKRSNKTVEKINEKSSKLISYIRENGPLQSEEDHRISIKNELFAIMIALLVMFSLVMLLL